MATSTMLEHYTAQDEGTRLTRTGHGRLELLRTRELLAQHLPAAPARVLDVGGGTGVHASWLAASLDFTDAYFHTPQELSAELTQAGFEDVRVFGVEGPAWTAVDAAGEDAARLMDSALLCARALEADEAMLAANAHLFTVGRATGREVV